MVFSELKYNTKQNRIRLAGHGRTRFDVRILTSNLVRRQYNNTWTLTSNTPFYDPSKLHDEQQDSLQTFIIFFQTTFLSGETGQPWTLDVHQLESTTMETEIKHLQKFKFVNVVLKNSVP